MSDQSNNNNSQINESEPSTFTALKDQFIGATKEVFGAVFNEDLQNAGAEQRIQGEKQLEETRQAPPSAESSSSSSVFSAPLSTSSEASKPEPTDSSKSSWFPSWSSSDATTTEAQPEPSSTSSSSSWFPWASSSEASETTSESSRATAFKDQMVGATKEVVGAVFNEDLQNAGAEQRIQGERDLQQLQGTSSPSREETWSDPSDPSKLSAIKDQLIGSTKEVLGTVLSENLHSAGVQQRIHGEREYEIAVMNQENQSNSEPLNETIGQTIDHNKIQVEGSTQPQEGEVKRVLNA